MEIVSIPSLYLKKKKKKKKKIKKVITIIQNCSHKLVTILGLKKIGPGILLYHKDFNRLKFSAKKKKY